MMLAIASGAAAPPAEGEIVAYTDEQGRRIFVNIQDEELRTAVASGGVSAGMRLMERRRAALAGIEDHIDSEAERYNVDPALVRTMIRVESAWNHRARSHKGALGLMQLLPTTAARFGVTELYDPQENVTAGVRYLRFLLDRFDENVELAVAAYNAGENAVERNGGIPPYRETREYVARIRTLYGGFGRGKVLGTKIHATVDRSGRIIYVNE
jgi:soluble lytic murein transglycosylase-like protein